MARSAHLQRPREVGPIRPRDSGPAMRINRCRLTTGQGTVMNSIRFPARLTWPRRSRTSTRRRFAAGSVALAAVLAGLAFTAGPAHASGTGFCLRANPQQADDFGAVIQWQCDDSDNSQNWTVTEVADPPGVGLLVQVKNNGTSQCLDADADQAYNFG